MFFTTHQNYIIYGVRQHNGDHRRQLWRSENIVFRRTQKYWKNRHRWWHDHALKFRTATRHNDQLLYIDHHSVLANAYGTQSGTQTRLSSFKFFSTFLNHNNRIHIPRLVSSYTDDVWLAGHSNTAFRFTFLDTPKITQDRTVSERARDYST